jgi:hypothetical protein
MRCPDCNKFVGLEFQDPEVNDLEYSGGQVLGNVRLVRTCSECSQELKDAALDIEATVDPKWAEKHDGHDISVEFEPEQIEEGGGRYKKAFFGAGGTITVTCSDCNESTEVEWSDKVAASDMEEIG